MAAAALLRLLLVASTSTAAAALAARDGAALPAPAIVQIVADDLGYNDLGFTNGEKTRERRARLSIWPSQPQLSSSRGRLNCCRAA
jgi:hypothetical protein